MADVLPIYDPPTSTTLNATAAAETGSGAALMSLSEPLHVILGAVLIALGVFTLGWNIIHRQSPIYDLESDHLSDYDPPTGRLLVILGVLHLAVGGFLVVRGEAIHHGVGAFVVLWGVFLFAWRFFYRRKTQK